MRLVVEHRREQRRHAVEDRRIVAVHQIEHPRRRRALAVQNRGGADRHREGQRVAETVGKEQLCGGEADIVLADAEHLLRIGVGGRLHVRVDVAHALGHAGRAGRIEPERRLIRMRGCRRELIAFARDLLGELLVPILLGAGDHDMLEIGHAADDVLDDGIERFGDEQHARAAVGEDVGVLICGQQRVERHRHDAGADRAQKHDREVDRIQHDHRHALFAADAEPTQHVGGAARLALEFAIGEPETVSSKTSLLPRPSSTLRSSSQVTAL